MLAALAVVLVSVEMTFVKLQVRESLAHVNVAVADFCLALALVLRVCR